MSKLVKACKKCYLNRNETATITPDFGSQKNIYKFVLETNCDYMFEKQNRRREFYGK